MFYEHNFAFMKAVKEGGCRVINVVSPLPRDNASCRVAVHDAVRAVLHEYHEAISVPLVDITDETRDLVSGALDPRYASTMANDKIHGNELWGNVMAVRLAPVLETMLSCDSAFLSAGKS